MPLQNVLTVFKISCKVFIREDKAMRVIKYIRASEIAGVSRQAIYDLKKINDGGKRKYPFFIFDMNTGKPGVNIDDPSWKDYLDRNKNKRVKKKPNVNNTNQSISKDKPPKTDIKTNKNIIDIFVPAVKNAVIEIFGASKAEMKRFLNAIDRELEGKL